MERVAGPPLHRSAENWLATCTWDTEISTTMRERGVANSVIEAVRRELRFYPSERAARVRLRIGELVGIDPDAVRSCFEELVSHLDLAPLALEIDRCRAGSGSRGDVLDIAYLELEEVDERGDRHESRSPI